MVFHHASDLSHVEPGLEAARTVVDERVLNQSRELPASPQVKVLELVHAEKSGFDESAGEASRQLRDPIRSAVAGQVLGLDQSPAAVTAEQTDMAGACSEQSQIGRDCKELRASRDDRRPRWSWIRAQSSGARYSHLTTSSARNGERIEHLRALDGVSAVSLERHLLEERRGQRIAG